MRRSEPPALDATAPVEASGSLSAPTMFNSTVGYGTKDFVAACKAQGIELRPWVPMFHMPIRLDPEEAQPLFGKHIREAIQAWKRLRCPRES